MKWLRTRRWSLPFPASRRGCFVSVVAAISVVVLIADVPPAVADPVVYVVNSLADPGEGACDADECTLREAMSASNGDAAPARIEFDLVGEGPHTIQPASPLPAVTAPVTIDGYTQPGARPNTRINGSDAVLLVELDGSHAGSISGLQVAAADTVVRGVVINRFEGTGILFVGATRSRIEGSFVGTDITGTVDAGNGYDGVALIDSSHNTIGGEDPAARNVVSGNANAGIAILNGGSVGNVVAGNLVGTNRDGTVALGNAAAGVLISAVVGRNDYASDNVVGGEASGARNVISGNASSGVHVFRGRGNRIAGNTIGTDVTRSAALPNDDGVLIVEASDNLVGGTQAGAGNVISGNRFAGVHLNARERDTTGNAVRGNLIGTDGSGVRPVGNGDGVVLQTFAGTTAALAGNTVGGADEDDGSTDGTVRSRNVISGNRGIGVSLVGHATSGNVVAGNLVGTDVTGAAPVPNGGHGVLVTSSSTGGDGASANVIGGTTAGAGNIVAANGRDGVQIGFGSFDNRVEGNFVGTTAVGDRALGNGRDGVAVFDSPRNRIGGHGLARNVISGNSGNGVRLSGVEARGNHVVGNWIGTDAFGSTPVGNGDNGVLLLGAVANIVGGATAEDGNVVSGNRRSGIRIDGTTATANVVHNNAIGIAADGVADVGNAEHGVLITDSSDNDIGGGDESARRGNVIAYNGSTLGSRGHGVLVRSGRGNLVRRNEIFANAGRAIDLGGDSFTLNDVALQGTAPVFDGDNGANDLQNFPEVSAVSFGFSFGVIEWTLHSAPNATYEIDFYANSSPDRSGFGEAERYVRSRTVTTDATGRAEFGEVFELATTRYVSVTATDDGGNTSELSIVDTDADALADAWEVDGIDVNEDALVDFVPGGADPDHKDLYVEVDALNGFAPPAGTFPAVTQAFADAPAALVHNADRQQGIALHIDVDETAIPAHQWTGDLDGDGVDALGEDLDGDGTLDPGEDADGDGALAPGDGDDQGGWPWFDRIKAGALSAGGFGTAAERGDPDVINAKRLVYRYALFADRFVERRGNRQAVDVSGRSEYSGPHVSGLSAGTNDLFVTLGTWSSVPADVHAGTFMHEFGHTLGLGHGGHDDINYKPNYHSVMSYTWQFPRTAYGPGSPCPSWRLDYSTRALATLNEAGLAEPAGIEGDPSLCVPIGPVVDASGAPQPPQLVRRGVPLDFDGDGDATDIGVARDVNFLEPSPTGSPGEILVGHEDWSQLLFSFRLSPDFADGVHQATSKREMTLEDAELLAAIGVGAGELQFSQERHDVREHPGEATVRVVRAGGTDSRVTVDVASVGGSATAGSDYVAVAGTVVLEEGSHVATFTVPLLDDSLAETPETIELALSNPTGGATVAAASSAELRVLDDDALLVTNTEDDWPGSLRRALLAANARPGRDTILFDIAGPGVHTIAPLSPLPPVADPVTIDGYSQAGARPNTRAVGNDAVLQIELDGSRADSGLIGVGVTGLEVGQFGAPAPGSTIRGLVINRFSESGIVLGMEAAGSTVEGNFLGVEADGTTAAGNNIGVVSLATATVIGGSQPAARNVISANRAFGVFLASPARRNVVQGNYVGTDRHGQAALGNAIDGVTVWGRESTIGGSAAGAANLLSGNGNAGVYVESWAAGTTVQGNLIGTDSHGRRALGNAHGVRYRGAGSTAIGGGGPGEGNVISGNTAAGVVAGAGGALPNAPRVVVAGNLIGTDKDGLAAIGNGEQGAGIEAGGIDTGIVIGGLETPAGNIISGHDGPGIRLSGRGTVVKGNLIGLGADGRAPMGNAGGGIEVRFGASGNTIGGSEPGAGNTIAFNGLAGVHVDRLKFGGRAPSRGITVSGNAMFSNDGLGIDLDGDGVTPNDADDADTGGNGRLNFPLLTAASIGADGTRVDGSIQTAPATTLRIEFFSSDEPDPSAHGEGKVFLGATTVASDSEGTAHFAPTLPVTADAGHHITATATDAAGNTSEFSAALPLAPVASRLHAQPVVATVGLGPMVHFPELRATLTNGVSGVPLPGKLIAFSAGGDEICTAVTDAEGAAVCHGIDTALSALLKLGYRATFLGDAGYAPAAADGPVVAVRGPARPLFLRDQQA